MGKYRLFCFLIFISQLISFCNNNQDKQVTPRKDTVKNNNPVDTAVAVETMIYDDCNDEFFSQTSKSIDTSALKVKLKNGHRYTWKEFVNDELMSSQVSWGLKDLDNDSLDELVVFNYTGGAHCCNELYIFKKAGAEYIQKGKLFAGFECIDAQSNMISYSLNESLGYFFGCYACGFTDETGTFKTIREIELRYDHGRFVTVPYSAERENQLFQNLEVLGKHKYEDMEEGLMDSGWRKEFAMNFAVWHYNHGKNWRATKELFDKYYKFKDAPRVWKEFRYTLREMEKDSDL
jgi:hypothetical protein